MYFEQKVPTFDANSESLTVIEVITKEKQYVQKGDILMILESAKAIYELESEEEGFVECVVSQGEECVPSQTCAVIAPTVEELSSYKKADLRIDQPLKKESASHGIRLAIAGSGLSDEEVASRLLSAGRDLKTISREELEQVLGRSDGRQFDTVPLVTTGKAPTDAKFKRDCTTREKEIIRSLGQVRSSLVEMWLTAEVEISETLGSYKKYSIGHGLAGTAQELVIWAVLEWVRQNAVLSRFLWQGQVFHWDPAGVVLVLEWEDTLFLPVIRVKECQAPVEDTSQINYDLKRKVIARKLGAADFVGGGVVLSLLENSDVKAFNAIPSPSNSYALAVSVNETVDSSRLSLTFTYDHRLINGLQAANLISELSRIIKSWKK